MRDEPELSKALESARAELSGAPADRSLVVRYLELLVQSRQDPQTDTVLLPLLERDPWVREACGDAFAKANNLEKAAAQYTAANSLGAASPERLRKLAKVLHRSGRTLLAFEAAAKAVELGPDDESNHQYYASLLLAECERLFRAAVTIRPELQEKLETIGNLLPKPFRYQTFADQTGVSDSSGKWEALRIPDDSLRAKRVLDLGCNEGFFCLKAAAAVAAKVVGIDHVSGFISAAKARIRNSPYSNIEIACQDWNTWRPADESYDLVLLLSAFHYATAPADFDALGRNALIQKIASALCPGGLFVLETGLVQKDTEEWVQWERPWGKVFDGTKKAVEKTLQLSFSKVSCIGRSVDQPDDPMPRFVFHCYR